ncbi:hypothetical protein JQ615_34605, partial [Bradyrhizobium jicamae]
RDYTDGRDGVTTYFSYDGGAAGTLSGLTYNNEYSGNVQVNNGDTADFTQLDVFGVGNAGETNNLSQTDIEVMEALGWEPVSNITDFYGGATDSSVQGGGFTNYYADSGNDFIGGNPTGNSEFFGGAGNSVISTSTYLTFTGTGTTADPFILTSFTASTGNDVIFGGSGKDQINAPFGNDTVYGGSGNLSGLTTAYAGEVFYAGIYGGNGNDVFYAGSGNDLIVAGNGNDVFYGGSGHSTMYGGSGNDIYVGGDGLSYEVGGQGTATSLDYFYLSSAQGSEAYGTKTGESVFVAGTNGAVMIGQGGNDFMFAAGGNNYFYGGTGNSEFFGGSGVDVMSGAGNDYFDGGTGVNYYFGGNGGGPGTGIGTDIFNVSLGGGDVVQDWTEGKDTVQLNGSGFHSFADVLSHSYQNGAYFVVQVNPDTSVWLNGATAASVKASDFTIVS